ncbi:MAG: hypothetical protein Tsb0020_12970 [Haliangiales bacterium]
MPSQPIATDAADLIARYPVILLDAYGVLVNGDGALPTGRLLLDEIARQGRRFYVVTNDASRLPETCARRFHGLGLDIEADRVITSGSLLSTYFREHSLVGARCMVLGTADAKTYVREAGGELVPIRAEQDCEVVVVGDDSGYPFLEAIEETLSMLYRRLSGGHQVALLLPNPDIIYPKSLGRYGFTSGGVAALIEAGLGRLFPEQRPRFVPLGKPHQPMFDEARRRADSDQLVMIGDQLETDIAGANRAGIDSALVQTGVSQWRASETGTTPTYLLAAAGDGDDAGD